MQEQRNFNSTQRLGAFCVPFVLPVVLTPQSAVLCTCSARYCILISSANHVARKSNEPDGERIAHRPVEFGMFQLDVFVLKFFPCRLAMKLVFLMG